MLPKALRFGNAAGVAGHHDRLRLAGQHLFPTTLPVGVVTGIVGAPYLVLQLIRLNRQGASA